MAKVIKELKGHSGSTVYLMDDGVRKFVRKVGNVERNYERLSALSIDHDFLRVPYVYNYDGETLDMEYIHGLDMKTYLTYNDPAPLTEFLLETLGKFENSYTGNQVDYLPIYKDWLSWFDAKDELIEKLPRYLPETAYHGDLTLENIIYGNDGHFYLIDAVEAPWKSYVFDIAKLRQDLDCGWFMRHNPRIMPELSAIKNAIYETYPTDFNDFTLVLMLLRVYKHCTPGTLEYDFIINEVRKLWK